MALVIMRVSLNGTFSGNFSRFMLACITALQLSHGTGYCARAVAALQHKWPTENRRPKVILYGSERWENPQVGLHQSSNDDSNDSNDSNDDKLVFDVQQKACCASDTVAYLKAVSKVDVQQFAGVAV